MNFWDKLVLWDVGLTGIKHFSATPCCWFQHILTAEVAKQIQCLWVDITTIQLPSYQWELWTIPSKLRSRDTNKETHLFHRLTYLPLSYGGGKKIRATCEKCELLTFLPLEFWLFFSQKSDLTLFLMRILRNG